MWANLRTALLAAAPLLFAPASPGQTAAAPLSFEVASVKPAPPPTAAKDEYSEGYAAGVRAGLAAQGVRIRGQSVSVTDNTLRDLIRYAYGVRDYQISAPGWMAEQKYQISATMPADATRDQVPTMLRVLLAERFHLALRRESRTLSVYALVAVPGPVRPSPTAYPNSRFPQCSTTPGRIRGIAAPLPMLADAVGKATGQTVVDMTDLPGLFDFDLAYNDVRSPEDAPSLQAALRQLGLRLEKRAAPVDQVIVERADRIPTGN